MTKTRKVLSLPATESVGESQAAEARVPVGIFDVQLPARQFLVHHKVAEVGDVSLTTEFFVRLLYSADGLPEETAARFFGFNPNEMAYVLKDAETRAYVSRLEGRIWLTDAGHALFKEGDKPQIYDVVKRIEKVGFDLLSLAPCEREYQSEFERGLPELQIRNPELVANASKHIPDRFRRFYGEISSRKDKDAADVLKRSLYSVDEILPGDKFSAIVPFVAMASIRRPSEPEPLLDAWKVGYELSDRDHVVHGVAEFLENLRRSRTAEDANALEVLADFAPEYLKEYRVKSGFSTLRYFKELAGRAGELRSDRPTVGIVGALYQPENIERITAAIHYSKRPQAATDNVFVWIIPSQSTWGTSRHFPNLIEKLSKEDVPSDSHGKIPERMAVLIDDGKPAWHLVKALPATYVKPNNGAIPNSLEILLIPERVTAITVHAPITLGSGFPVPLGILSFDQTVVRRVHHYLTTQLPPEVAKYGMTDGFALRRRLEWRVDESVNESLKPDGSNQNQ